MDNDDPIVHSKIFKFIKSKGKSLLEYYWGSTSTVKEAGKSIEMKGKGEPAKNPDDLTVTQIVKLLKSVKSYISQTILNLTQLSENIRELILLVVKEKKAYVDLAHTFIQAKDQETDKELMKLYGETAELWDVSKDNQNKLSWDAEISIIPKPWKGLLKFSDFKALNKSYCILNQYLKVERAINRLLDLAIDVEDLKGILQKYHEEPDKFETYKAEYHYYLRLLRTNFDFLKEDSGRMQAKEDKNLKDVIEEYYMFQKQYFQHQSKVVSLNLNS